MKCKVCGNEMHTGTENGKPCYACVPCGKTLILPSAGPTTPHPTNTRIRTQNASPGILEPNRGISDGENRFASEWIDLHPDYPFKTEYEFSVVRGWKIDFAWVEEKVAVEYEGGGAAGHGRKNRYDGDIEKYNAMAYEDWLLFRCTKGILESETQRDKFIRMVMGAIHRREKD